MIKGRIRFIALFMAFLLVFLLPFNAGACLWYPGNNNKIIWSNSDDNLYFDSGIHFNDHNASFTERYGRNITAIEIINSNFNTLAYSGGVLFDFSLSPDGKYLAYSSTDIHASVCSGIKPEIKIIDIDSDSIAKVFSEDAGYYTSFSWSPDGTKFAISLKSLKNGTIPEGYIYDSNTWMLLSVFQSGIKTSWSPDSKSIAVTSNYNVTIYNVNDFQVLHHINTDTYFAKSIDWSPDGSKLLHLSSKGRERYNIGIYDTTSWEEIKNLNGTGYGYSDAKWSPDGRYVAIGINKDSNNSSLENNIAIYNAETWKVISSFPTELHTIGAVSWSNDGSMLAVGDHSNPELLVYDTDTWELKYIFIDSVEDEIKPSDVDLAWSLIFVSAVVMSTALFILWFLIFKKKEEI